MEMLMTAIISFCQFKTANISIDNKEKCMEKMVNCAIVKDGQTSQELINKCKEKYLNEQQLKF